jgi:hypothetical protein
VKTDEPKLTELTFDAAEPPESTGATPAPAAPDPPDTVQFARESLGFEPDERQIQVLRTTAKRAILNCSRQWGKSTIAAAKAIHLAFTQPESLILIASPSKRQSAELLRKMAGMLRKLGIRPRGDGDNSCSLLLPNGSRIVALPGNESTVRGFSGVSMLLLDEAARMDEEMYQALRPMLATVEQGQLWMMSTPWGKRGFFYDTWEHGGDDWLRLSVPATECPRILPGYLENERRVMGPVFFGQEFLCDFVDCDGSLFDRDLIEAALDESLEPIDLTGTWKD